MSEVSSTIWCAAIAKIAGLYLRSLRIMNFEKKILFLNDLTALLGFD
jgi:hypothetical protein